MIVNNSFKDEIIKLNLLVVSGFGYTAGIFVWVVVSVLQGVVW